MAETGWQRKFEDPIPLPNGRQLVTLKDAADYIMKLPKTESDLPDWQVAIEALMLCSRGGGPYAGAVPVMCSVAANRVYCETWATLAE